MNTERLKFAIKALQSIPEGGIFDIREWGTHEDLEHSPEEKNYCGTQACAFGWIALNKDAPNLGLESRWRDGALEFRYEGTESEFHRISLASMGLNGRWTRWCAFEVAAAWLGITYLQSDWLFSPGSYDYHGAAVEEVISRMQQMITEAQ